MRGDGVDVLPGDAHDVAAPEPRRDPSHQARTLRPRSRAREDRDHLEPFAGTAFERELVRIAAASLLRVEQLMVDDVQAEVDGLAQFWPTFVRTSNGTALIEMTMITTR